jgi:nucleoside-diphosphate-sugar epimerase
VRATDLDATGGAPDIDYRKADILKPEELTPVIENATTVIHVAGLAHVFSPDMNSAENFRQINEIGTANVVIVAAVEGVGHLILISSVAVYGPHTVGTYDESTPCDPVGPYATSKYKAELKAIEISRESGMALTILRLSTLYGEGDPGNIGRLIDMLYRGCFLWIGDGNNRKSLLYIDDAARACMAVAVRPAVGINIFNVSAPACTMREVVEGIEDALGKHPLPVRIPSWIVLFVSRHFSKIPIRRIEVLHQTLIKWLSEDVYSTRQFDDAYSFQTKTSLRDGLKKEVNWHRRSLSCKQSKKEGIA